MTTATLEQFVARGQAAQAAVDQILIQERLATLLRVAEDLSRQKPPWLDFFKEILGADGLVRKLFPSPDERLAYEGSTTRLKIDGMLCRLREQALEAAPDKEPTRVITVRLPKSLHASLISEADERRTSLNKLCIGKLLQVLEGQEGATSHA
jgi:HicB family